MEETLQVSRKPGSFPTHPLLPGLGPDGREVSLPMWLHETVHLPLPVVKLSGARASLNRTEATFSLLDLLCKASSLVVVAFVLIVGLMAKPD